MNLTIQISWARPKEKHTLYGKLRSLMNGWIAASIARHERRVALVGYPSSTTGN
jgi:hypothetical protein